MNVISSSLGLHNVAQNDIYSCSYLSQHLRTERPGVIIMLLKRVSCLLRIMALALPSEDIDVITTPRHMT